MRTKQRGQGWKALYEPDRMRAVWSIFVKLSRTKWRQYEAARERASYKHRIAIKRPGFQPQGRAALNAHVWMKFY
eukprot:scaffold30174_cov31-Attheya_sp.AAC.1